jgi:hypothetical protein
MRTSANRDWDGKASDEALDLQLDSDLERGDLAVGSKVRLTT